MKAVRKWQGLSHARKRARRSCAGAAALTPGASAAAPTHACGNHDRDHRIAGRTGQAEDEDQRFRSSRSVTEGVTCTSAYKFITALYTGTPTGKTPEGYKCTIGQFTVPAGHVPEQCTKPGKKIQLRRSGRLIEPAPAWPTADPAMTGRGLGRADGRALRRDVRRRRGSRPPSQTATRRRPAALAAYRARSAASSSAGGSGSRSDSAATPALALSVGGARGAGAASSRPMRSANATASARSDAEQHHGELLAADARQRVAAAQLALQQRRELAQRADRRRRGRGGR